MNEFSTVNVKSWTKNETEKMTTNSACVCCSIFLCSCCDYGPDFDSDCDYGCGDDCDYDSDETNRHLLCWVRRLELQASFHRSSCRNTECLFSNNNKKSMSGHNTSDES